MSLSNMPMFELFPPIFKSKKIEQWTANEFWKHLKLSKKERNRFNRQRMYRLLRKLVEDGFLTKETNLVNPRLSTFSETNKLDQLREITGISLDFIQMRHSKEETQKKISMLEKQLESFSFVYTINLSPPITIIGSPLILLQNLPLLEFSKLKTAC